MAHLYASFQDAALAEKAAGALLDYGVRKEDLSIVANNAYGETRTTHSVGDHFAQTGDRMAGAVTSAVGADAAASGYEAGAARREANAPGALNDYGTIETDRTTGGDVENAAKSGISTTTPEDAGAGAVKGAEIGLGVGILAGLASLLVPGVGLVLGGGALASAIGAAALTTGAGAIAGGVTGYLKEQGVPGDAAERYQGIVEHGGAVLNVNLPSGNVDQATAEQVIAKYHATDVNLY